MFTRRTIFKGIAALGLGTTVPQIEPTNVGAIQKIAKADTNFPTGPLSTHKQSLITGNVSLARLDEFIDFGLTPVTAIYMPRQIWRDLMKSLVMQVSFSGDPRSPREMYGDTYLGTYQKIPVFESYLAGIVWTEYYYIENAYLYDEIELTESLSTYIRRYKDEPYESFCAVA